MTPAERSGLRDELALQRRAPEPRGERAPLPRDRQAVADRRELRCARELERREQQRARRAVVAREPGSVDHDQLVRRQTRAP